MSEQDDQHTDEDPPPALNERGVEQYMMETNFSDWNWGMDNRIEKISENAAEIVMKEIFRGADLEIHPGYEGNPDDVLIEFSSLDGDLCYRKSLAVAIDKYIKVWICEKSYISHPDEAEAMAIALERAALALRTAVAEKM